VDLRNIQSPIVVFCSEGDNITPPSQALGWVSDLYKDVDEIRSHGQTIIYSVHGSIGHLGIFVSAKIARKEHDEFAGNVDFIDILPPGLYEAILVPKSEVSDTDLVLGNWVLKFEPRTMEDLKLTAPSDREDVRRFATVARLSEINLELYRTLVGPWVRAAFAPFATVSKQLHPLRLQYELLSDANPAMRAVSSLAETVRANRRPVAADNPFLQMQNQFSDSMVKMLDAWREARDQLYERTFLSIYSSPVLQAMLGIGPEWTRVRAGQSPLYKTYVEAKKTELRGRMDEGGLREALLRALLHVVSAFGGADERTFEAIRRVRAEHAESRDLSLQDFKQALREQFYMLLIDRTAALQAIPKLLPADKQARRAAMDVLQRVVAAQGPEDEEVRRRVQEVEALFGLREGPAGALVAFASDRSAKRPARGA
jgi:hypothetical protein